MIITRTLATAFGVGLAVIALAVAGVFYLQRGAHLELTGKVLKVRTLALDDNSSLAAVDFRVTDPSDYPFQVHSVTVILEDKSGNSTEGQTVSEMDTHRVFASLPLLGEQYNDVLKERDRVGPHATADRMVMARFELPESKIGQRGRILVRIEEVDGAVAEISEPKQGARVP